MISKLWHRFLHKSRRMLNAVRFVGMSRNSVFQDIYERRAWGGADSVSGPGSDLSRTEPVRQALPALLRKLEARSLLDVPCGDFAWMRHVNLAGIAYVGADIVPDLIRQLQETCAGPERSFVALDLVTDSLPEVDLIFCRHCLIHLSNADVLKALTNIARSKCRYLCVSNYPGMQANRDIHTGQWRPLNLCLPPFSLPVPFTSLAEQPTTYRHASIAQEMSVWTVESLRDWLRAREGRGE